MKAIMFLGMLAMSGCVGLKDHRSELGKCGAKVQRLERENEALRRAVDTYEGIYAESKQSLKAAEKAAEGK